jgi:predicted ArsR family transcriptional regulator
MSPRESSILLLLKEQGPTSFIRIGEALNFDILTTIRVLNELSAWGLVTITQPPQCRGAAVYCLTARGRSALRLDSSAATLLLCKDLVE